MSVRLIHSNRGVDSGRREERDTDCRIWQRPPDHVAASQFVALDTRLRTCVGPDERAEVSHALGLARGRPAPVVSGDNHPTATLVHCN